MRRRVAAAGLVLLFAAPVVGCGEDDPVRPQPPDYAPTTPDSLLTLVEEAFTDRDGLKLMSLTRPGNLPFALAPEDTSGLEPPLAGLIRYEFAQATANLFVGRAIVNVRGDSVPAVCGLEDVAFTRISTWEHVSGVGTVPTEDCDVAVRMTIRSCDGGERRVSATWRVAIQHYQIIDDDQVFQDRYWLRSIVETARPDPPGAVTYGAVCLRYMTDPAPAAALSTTYTPTPPFGTCLADASASTDEPHRDPVLLFRWRDGTAADWGAWDAVPTHEFVFTAVGDHEIGVQVRDRWGQVDETSRIVAAVPIFP